MLQERQGGQHEAAVGRGDSSSLIGAFACYGGMRRYPLAPPADLFLRCVSGSDGDQMSGRTQRQRYANRCSALSRFSDKACLPLFALSLTRTDILTRCNWCAASESLHQSHRKAAPMLRSSNQTKKPISLVDPRSRCSGAWPDSNTLPAILLVKLHQTQTREYPNCVPRNRLTIVVEQHLIMVPNSALVASRLDNQGFTLP